MDSLKRNALDCKAQQRQAPSAAHRSQQVCTAVHVPKRESHRSDVCSLLSRRERAKRPAHWGPQQFLSRHNGLTPELCTCGVGIRNHSAMVCCSHKDSVQGWQCHVDQDETLSWRAPGCHQLAPPSACACWPWRQAPADHQAPSDQQTSSHLKPEVTHNAACLLAGVTVCAIDLAKASA